MIDLTFRPAVEDDLVAIVTLLADDELAAAREDTSIPLDPRYRAAFAAIAADPNQLLLVATDGDTVVGCLQISVIPGLSRKGMVRGQIESVRVASGHRGGGIGRAMIEFAVDECRRRACGSVQLTTDKSRHAAHRFYERLGFVASLEGMKLAL